MAAECDPDELEVNKATDVFSLNCQNMISALLQATLDFEEGQLEQPVLDSFWRAVFGFFANLCAHPAVRQLMSSSLNGKLLATLIPQVLAEIRRMLSEDDGQTKLALYQDITHRIVYIADEFYQEDKVNIFDRCGSSDLKKQALLCLKYFTGSAENNGGQHNNYELLNLCQQFVGLCGMSDAM